MQLQRSGEVTLAWFCLVYTRACELLTLVQVVHWLVSVMFLQTCLTGGVLTCLGMFVCLGSGGPLACLVMFKQTC